MIKTVTFNHFSSIYFFNLWEVACGAQATQEYQSKIYEGCEPPLFF